nr:VCBS repeat-containing protein [candidate division Zixibacteria bacterium]
MTAESGEITTHGTSGDFSASRALYPAESNLIEVMFRPQFKIRLRKGRLVDSNSRPINGLDGILGDLDAFEWSRICLLPEARFDEFQARGQAKSGRTLYNLNNIYRLAFSGKIDIQELCRKLGELTEVMSARPVPLPPPLPAVGNYETSQYYLNPASSSPSGIDAEFSWTQPGGTGAGVTICDIEYGWNYSHADIAKAQNSQINPEPIALPPGETDDHGTAVLGILVSDNNGWGTTGLCYGADIKTCGAYYGDPLSFNPAGAIAYAIDSLSTGDIILLELQWDYGDPNTTHTDFIPIEWYGDYYPDSQSYNAVYAAIENAVANGIHVVEAGGNGGAPTANSGYNTGSLNWYGHSGAVIVGAGGAYAGGTYPQGNLERIYWSSYGPRYDLQGGGEDVVTTGYGYLYSTGGKDSLYTNIFAGTSSASPMVAGAIACCMSYSLNQGWSIDSLNPAKIRDVLWSTGTPQVMGPTGYIGPRPNLKKAFDSLSSFTDATFWALRNTTRGTYGIAWGDYDNDDDLDFYVSNYFSPNNLYQNDGNGNFTEVASSPINDSDPGTGVAWGDYDNDGYLDIYNVKLSIGGSLRPNKLFHNNGNGTFSDVTPAVLADTGFSYGLGWADYDLDGDIDLFFTNDNYYGTGNKLMRNDGGGNFTDVTSSALPPTGDYSHSMAWGDYDNDGYPDIYITKYGASRPNLLLRNNGNGTFSDVTAAPLNITDASYGLGWGDYDNDGYLDLFVACRKYSNHLLHNNGNGTFTDVTSGPLAGPDSTVDVVWGDYDNDMDLDLYLVNNKAANKLFRNDGGGAFTDITVSSLALIDTLDNTSAACGDYDADGDLDLVIGAYQQFGNSLLKNRIGANNHWLHVNLVGTNANRFGIGARVRVVAGSISQIDEISGGSNLYSQNSLTAEFGLGSYTVADTVEINWPTTAQSITVKTNVNANQVITVYEVASYVCGDANGGGSVNILDVTYLINYLYKSGPAPEPQEAGDANGNGAVNILDVTYLISYLYKSGPEPICP